MFEIIHKNIKLKKKRLDELISKNLSKSKGFWIEIHSQLVNTVQAQGFPPPRFQYSLNFYPYSSITTPVVFSSFSSNFIM